MSMVEDDAIAILALVREQQTAIERAAGVMERAAGTVASDHVKLSRAAEDVKSIVEASKTAAETGAAAGVKESLSVELEALRVAINAAVKRMNSIKAPALHDRFMWSMYGSAVGAAFIAIFVGLAIIFEVMPVKANTSLNTKSIAAAILEDMHQQQPPPRKKKQP